MFFWCVCVCVCLCVFGACRFLVLVFECVPILCSYLHIVSEYYRTIKGGYFRKTTLFWDVVEFSMKRVNNCQRNISEKNRKIKRAHFR